ncbi:UvrD-helicase domain-containing protein [Paenibacillus sp. 2TAF8]|uniref:UvrD-helicase domain-containing protein n=1 Tax=Paenibacillus sp. 2TAF8 TaxID=3233020 RepID=UPI003F9AF5AF
MAPLAIRFQYLFVDEVQDTDLLQERVIDHLLYHLIHILVLVDRKRAIYGFLGADELIIKKDG